MYPHGYGNPHNANPPGEQTPYVHHQHSMMQDRQISHCADHLHHHAPEYHSTSFHYPPAPAPSPYPPFDNPRPPPHSYPPPYPSPYPPQPINPSFYPPPPPHSSPQHVLPHASSFDHQSHYPLEHAYMHLTSNICHHTTTHIPHHSLSLQEPHGDARPTSETAFYSDHTTSFQEPKPWYPESFPRVTTQEVAPPSSISHVPPVHVELPKGQLVRVFCKADRKYNLAVKEDRLMMVEADTANESQQWVRDNKYGLRVRDSYGHPAFMLINKASKKVLKHAKDKLLEVQLIDYDPANEEDDLFWTESQDFGEGFKTVRMASDTLLNLTAGNGNKLEDGSTVILDTWHKKDNQLWKVFPL